MVVNMKSLTKENKNSSTKIKVFPRRIILTSDNPKIKEILKKLEDKSIIDRIRSYSETHSLWEDKGW